jgi:hypothetical protein
MRHSPARDDRLQNTDETAGYVGGRIQCPIFCTSESVSEGFWNYAWDLDQEIAQKANQRRADEGLRPIAAPPSIDPYKYSRNTNNPGFVSVLDITKFYYYAPEALFGHEEADLRAGNWLRLVTRLDGIDPGNQTAVNSFVGARVVPVRYDPTATVVKPDPTRHFLDVASDNAAGLIPFVAVARNVVPVDRLPSRNQRLKEFRLERIRFNSDLKKRLNLR